MDHRRKMLATASSQAEGACPEFIVDRFSDLPVGVAHHILSFLPFKDIGQVGCVSKRCLELYLSYPSLIFNPSHHQRNNMWRRLEAFNYFDKFLANRDSNKIECLRISWDYHSVKFAREFNELLRISTWIRHAARCNVQVLDLDFDTRCRVPLELLPSSISACKSLRTLVIDFHWNILKWPSSNFLTNLQCLKLKSVQIEGLELFGKWIPCCKFLKQLQLEYVSGIKRMTVISSSLESFSFVLYDRNPLCYLGISVFEIGWEFDGSPETGNLTCLEKAEIYLYPKVDESDKLFEVLCSIGRSKVLILNEETMKALCRKSPMPTLDGISYLGLHTSSLSDELFPKMVSLLNGMTTLRKLCITSNPSFIRWRPLDAPDNSSRYNTSCCGSHNLACMHELQEVIIELSNGTNEWKLAKYILEHIQSLKKMVILYSSKQEEDVVLRKKPEMISAATVVFQKK
ncbi:F-box/LRR-repeat protein [Prunus yedoensis var. nudiflora]|uniref:F-box/LRR-repeat protein n=1 Tax=Prunus yedoensis var. nudiflora TaxID=2094558 RepID=A0A314ZAM1_PRUYE|nr:F-box/LRR-repeat protein [Prunus yedoensis var. nudiflora]